LSDLVDDPYPYPIDDAAPPTAPAVAPPPVPEAKAVAPAPSVVAVTPVTPPVSPVTKAAPVVPPTTVATPAAVANPVAVVDPMPAPDPAPYVPLELDPASTPAGIKSTWSKRKETVVGIAENGSPITMAYGMKVLWNDDIDVDSTSVMLVETILAQTVSALHEAGLADSYRADVFDLGAMMVMREDELNAIETRAVEDLRVCDWMGNEARALRCVICAVVLVRYSQPAYFRFQTSYPGSLLWPYD